MVTLTLARPRVRERLLVRRSGPCAVVHSGWMVRDSRYAGLEVMRKPGYASPGWPCCITRTV